MNITEKILSGSKNGLKTTIKDFATGLGKKIGITQKEVQECAGKSAQEIAEITSKKDVVQIAATNSENATVHANKKLSFRERLRAFGTKLSDKLTNKLKVKDKSAIEVWKAPNGTINKYDPIGHMSQWYNPSTRNYITSTRHCSIKWKLSKNPIKRFLGLNNIESVEDSVRRVTYRKNKYFGYTKSTPYQETYKEYDHLGYEKQYKRWRDKDSFVMNLPFSQFFKISSLARPFA